MLVRVLFLLLLAMNIGGGCWLYFAPQRHAPVPPATDARVPKLVLLSERERPGEANASELASAPESASFRAPRASTKPRHRSRRP